MEKAKVEGLSEEAEIAGNITPQISSDLNLIKGKLQLMRKTEPQRVVRCDTEFNITIPAGRGKRRIITSKIESVTRKKRKKTSQSKDLFRKNLNGQDYVKIVAQPGAGEVDYWIATPQSYVRISKEELEELAGTFYALAFCSGKPCSGSSPLPSPRYKKYQRFLLNIQKTKNLICKVFKNARN